MNQQPDPVVEAARNFLDDLMPRLERECPGGDDRALPFGWPRWVPVVVNGHEIGRYKALPRFLTAEQQCAVRMLGELREADMRSLAELEAALAADPTIGPRHDHDVTSSAAGGSGWHVSSMVEQLVDRAIEQADDFELEARARDSLTTEWAKLLRRSTDPMHVVVALHEFRAPAVSIRLEPDGVEIDELSDREIEAALTLGAGRKDTFSLDERWVNTVFGIRKPFESRLFIDGVPPEASEEETAVRIEARELAERVVLALRVFKAGRVGISGSFEYATGWDEEISPTSGTFLPSFGWHPGEPYVLAEEEVESFREFWSDFEKVQARPVVSGGLRRFNLARDRTLPDDEIVDLMIAAEALFLREMNEKYRGEMRFRLAVRAASLLGTTLEERLRVAKFMRHAYDVRSTIVHGGAPSEDELQGLSGERVPVHEFADDLEGVVRDTLQTAIRRLAGGESFPPNWEKIMFVGPPKEP